MFPDKWSFSSYILHARSFNLNLKYLAQYLWPFPYPFHFSLVLVSKSLFYPLLKTFLHISYLHGRSFWKMGFTPKNANFFLIALAKLSTNNDNVIPILLSSCHHIIIVMSTIAPIDISKLPYICICSRVIAISL